MKYLVCIAQSGIESADPTERKFFAKEGEIYTFNGFFDPKYIFLKEMGYDWVYLLSDFRPVDDTFGEVVSETIIEQVEYEEAIA